MIASLAVVDDLRVFLGLDEIDEDRAQFFLDGVGSEVHTYTEYVFGRSVDHQVTLDGSGTSIILLPGPPVVNVTTVSEGGVELDDSAYQWNEEGLLLRYGGWWSQVFRNVVVTYDHGIEDVPQEVRMLVCRVAARGFTNPTQVTNEGMGGYNAGYGYDASRLPALSPDERAFLRRFMGR